MTQHATAEGGLTMLPGREASSPLFFSKNYRYLAKIHRYFNFFKNKIPLLFH
jgi:hypothetical protein